MFRALKLLRRVACLTREFVRTALSLSLPDRHRTGLPLLLLRKSVVNTYHQLARLSTEIDRSTETQTKLHRETDTDTGLPLPTASKKCGEHLPPTGKALKRNRSKRGDTQNVTWVLRGALQIPE